MSSLSKIIENLMSWWNKLPLLILEITSIAFYRILDLSKSTFESLSEENKARCIQIYLHLDILFGVALLFSLFLVIGSRKRRATWTDVFLTIFWTFTSLGFMAFALYHLVMSQFVIFHRAQEKDGFSEQFIATLPLDLNPSLKFSDIEHFMNVSGSRGRLCYALFLLFDFFFLACYTILHRQIFSITYSKSTNSFMYFATQRLPILLAALDIYEDCVFASLLFWFAKSVNSNEFFELSPNFVHRISSVTGLKILLSFVLIGMQVSGLVQHFLDIKWNFSANPSFPQKDVQEKQNAVLDSKKSPKTLRNRKKR